MKFLHLILSNLKRKKLRTVFTVLSIAVAFILFGFLSAIKQALTGGVTLEGANRLVVRHKVSIIQLLPASYEARIERIPGVAMATHFTWFGGIYKDAKNFFAQMPVVPEKFLAVHPEFILAPEQKEAWLKTRTGAIVGRKLAERFKFKLGDKIPLQATIWIKEGGDRLWEFDVVGIYDGKEKNTDTTALYFRYDYFDESRPVAKGEVGWYIIRVQDPDRAPDIARQIDTEFENSPAETKTETEGAFVQAFARQVGNIALITAGVISAVFFTILLVTGNTMSQSVRERLGELGLLKAVGFTNFQVLALVLGESYLLALLGAGAGLGAAWVLTSGGDPTGGMLPLFYFPEKDMVVGLGLALLLGGASGIFPALLAMRLRVADALRRM